MNTPLREVLREKAVRYAAQAEKNKEVIEEWKAAIQKLFLQLQEWLKTIDPEGIIAQEIDEREITEPGLGRYSIPTLSLKAFGKWVGMIPKARKTIKKASPVQNVVPHHATGRVDITDELRRFVLYRFGGPSGDEWAIHDVSTTDGPRPLTRDEFESALIAYFQ